MIFDSQLSCLTMSLIISFTIVLLSLFSKIRHAGTIIAGKSFTDPLKSLLLVICKVRIIRIEMIDSYPQSSFLINNFTYANSCIITRHGSHFLLRIYVAAERRKHLQVCISPLPCVSDFLILVFLLILFTSKHVHNTFFGTIGSHTFTRTERKLRADIQGDSCAFSLRQRDCIDC